MNRRALVGWEKVLGVEHLVSLCESPLAYDAVQKAKYWVKSCQANHPKCASDGLFTLPTRVLDLGTRTDSLDLYLVQTEVVLSHCWGTIPTLKTTSATLAKRLAAFSNFRMPLTLLVGWVISILGPTQDDPNDWGK